MRRAENLAVPEPRQASQTQRAEGPLGSRRASRTCRVHSAGQLVPVALQVPHAFLMELAVEIAFGSRQDFQASQVRWAEGFVAV